MGKQTAFLEYERVENKEIPVEVNMRELKTKRFR